MLEGKSEAMYHRMWLLSGLEFSNFTVKKRRFRAKQFQGTVFESGFRKENVIVSSNPKASQANSSPRPPQQEEQLSNPISTTTALVCM